MIDVDHAQPDSSVSQYFGFMRTINGQEIVCGFVDAQIECELGDAPAAVATHGTGETIGIEIDHLKIVGRMGIQQHESIGANAQSSMAELFNLCRIQVECPGSIVDQDEIVAGPLILVEVHIRVARRRSGGIVE